MPKNPFSGNGGISVVQQDSEWMICPADFPVVQAVLYPQKVVFNRQPLVDCINDLRIVGSWSANHFLVMVD
jgi:hypothetical protein